MVAQRHVAWRVSLLRDRRYRRLGRRVECEHRVGSGVLGRHPPYRAWPRCLYCADHGRRQLPENHSWHRHHVGVRGPVQSPAVASPVRVCRTAHARRLIEGGNMPVTDSNEILKLSHITHGFQKAQDDMLVLDDVNLELRKGEIVGLLGRSGCGKSSLLRIISGLINPLGGEADYLGKPIAGPAEGIAMVFQTFALFPWLTVLDNVEAGLEALGVPPDERRRRALAAIDLIGLDGFENAYPRELSGGMRQRVGFARAPVVGPTLLLIDEPFSALDVLTAETLRTDLLDLWIEHRLPTKSMLLVTHNIEEAVFMCDRILVF